MPWQEYTDDSTGRKYYYNAATQETSWVKPKAEPDPQWKKYATDDGRPYYYHFGTQETVWEQPESFVPEQEGPTHDSAAAADTDASARSRLPKPDCLSATEAKVPLRPGMQIVILADSMYRGQKAKLEKYIKKSGKWGSKLLGEDKRVALSPDDFGVPGWKPIDESEVQDLSDARTKTVIAPKSATKKKKEAEKNKKKQNFKEGDKLLRKGRPCTVLKVDYQTHPPTFIVLDHQSNQEINTEIKHLERPGQRVVPRRKAATGPFKRSEDQMIQDLALRHRALQSLGGQIYFKDVCNHFNQAHPQGTRTIDQIRKRYEELNAGTAASAVAQSELSDEFFESQRVEVKVSNVWKSGTVDKKHGPTIYDIMCDDGTQFLQHHVSNMREEGKGGKGPADPDYKPDNSLPSLEEQLNRQAVSKPSVNGGSYNAKGEWEHDVVKQNKDYLASILGFDAGDPDNDPEPEGPMAGKIDLRKYMTEGKKFECSACEQWKPYNRFTKGQLNKVAKRRRCNQCIVEANIKIRCSECGTTDKSKFLKSVINMKAKGKVRCIRCSKQYESRFQQVLDRARAGHEKAGM